MPRILTVGRETFPIAGSFTISRGSRTEAEVVTCTITEGNHTGRGECVPYRRYGESVESVIAAIDGIRGPVEGGIDRLRLQGALPAGAARNALDCALWDLEAKLSGRAVADSVGPQPPVALTTAYTLSLGTPESMAAQARENAWRPLLKVKVGTADGDIERIRAVASAAPDSRIILDANEGWTPANLEANLAAAAEIGIALIEQPLPAGQDEILRSVRRSVPLCADESAHVAEDLRKLAGLYDVVNIKLDKAGGLTEALRMRDEAVRMGFGVMVGCMVGTSLAMAPAVLLAQGAAFVDLDGPLLLARDRDPGLRYEGSLVLPPERALWG